MIKAFCLFPGASKDMVESGGIRIYPLEIERVIYSHPDIFEAAAIGVSDPQWGEASKAVIVLQPNAKLECVELVNFCNAEVGGIGRVVAAHGSGQGEPGPVRDMFLRL
jgi:acyl-CoA synthetase (AMP-forming)/AMP-acid ligase II